MAIAKTPKTPAAPAKPAAVKAPVAKSAVTAKKTAAAAAKAPEEAVIHSAEIAAETAAQATESVTQAAEAAISEAAKTAVSQARKASSDAAAAMAEAPAAKSSTALVVQAKQAGDEMLSRGVGPLLDFGRENAILLVSAGNELALGLHKLSLSLLDWSAESCDKGVAASQAMLSARTVEEVMDLSRSMAKDGLQQILKESSELSALSTKLLEETLVPLPVRFVAAVEKLASHAA